MKAKTSAYVVAQALAVVIVLVLISLPLEAPNSHEAPTSSTSSQQLTLTASSCTSTSTTVERVLPVSSEAQLLSVVNATFSDHLLHFTLRDTFDVTNDFENGAQMVWAGNTEGFGGNYTGLRSINEVYEGFLEPTTALSVINESWTLAPIGSESVVVYSTLDFEGHNNIWGSFDAQILGRDYYVAANGWQISQESWNFTRFAVQNSLEAMPYGPAGASCYQ